MRLSKILDIPGVCLQIFENLLAATSKHSSSTKITQLRLKINPYPG
jgi:hypothetical protein